MKKKLNVRVDHSNDAFFTDNITVIHSPAKFIFDFTQSIPRYDRAPDGSGQESLAIKHNTILMDPGLAKVFAEVLKDNLEKFEKKHGKINVKKKVSKISKGKATTAKAETRYIG